jgi:hypothetical protein
VRRLLLVLLCSTLVATACGGSNADKTSGNPEGALLVALLKLQNAPTTVTVTLRSDARSLQALDAQAGHGSLGSEASTILNSSITVSHTQASDPSKARSQTVVNLGGDNAIETRMIDRTLYLRVDAAGLGKAMGKSPAELRRAAREAKAAGLDFVGPALAGKWLSIARADKLGRQSGMTLPGSSKQKQARDAFLQRLLGSATVSEVGDDDAGTHMAISVPARQAYEGLMDMISNMGSGLPPGAALPDPSSVPDKNIKVDAWVRDGSLTQLEIDLRQFAALGGHPLPSDVDALALRMTIHAFTGTIDAPSGAMPVDVKQLRKLFSGATASQGGGLASAPTSAFSQLKCSDLAKLPKSQLKTFTSSIPPPQLKMLSHHCPALHLRA